MRVRLIDVDSKIPNLALMQISAWHKSRGDEVGFDTESPEKVYISCIFTKNRSQALGIGQMFPGAEISFGGSGINYDWLPGEMQDMKPDYDLYPSKFSQGFTTRGCIRNCGFCIVPKKEGKIQIWHHPQDFHDARFDTCMIMDNNLFAVKDPCWIDEVFDWFRDNKVKMLSPQGWDARLLTAPKAEALRNIKHGGPLHFAWDNPADEKIIRRSIKLLNNAEFDLRREVSFYVLVGYNTTFEQDVYRCEALKSLGVQAFAMRYRKTRELNGLARWTARPQLFWSCDFSQYTRSDMNRPSKKQESERK